ncbi:HTH domain-containing protein, partial [Bacillus safensis]
MKKSERLNQELIFLSDKHSFQLKDLQSEFGISKRTALRDIEELES